MEDREISGLPSKKVYILLLSETDRLTLITKAKAYLNLEKFITIPYSFMSSINPRSQTLLSVK